MGLLTENVLSKTLDIPISQPAVELKQGDWIVIATIKLAAPAIFTYRFASLRIISSAVSLGNVDVTNEVNPNLGVAYLALFQNYTSGNPSNLVSLDALSADSVGAFNRPTTTLTISTASNYSWVLVNNMKTSSTNTLVTSDVDLDVSANGVCRIHLEGA